VLMTAVKLLVADAPEQVHALFDPELGGMVQQVFRKGPEVRLRPSSQAGSGPGRGSCRLQSRR
jgi:hypothetical protein